MLKKVSKGSLLFELLIVTCVLCFLATASVVRLGFFDKFKLFAEFNSLYSTFEYLRQAAIADNRVYELIFDLKNNYYKYDGLCHFLPEGIKFGLLRENIIVPSNQSGILKKPITFLNNRAIFYPSGVISFGFVCLVDSKKAIMYCLSNGISKISLIRKYKYDNTWVAI